MKVLNMPQVHSIKEMDQKGRSIAEIARKLELDEKTVRKYLKMDDFSPQIPER